MDHLLLIIIGILLLIIFALSAQIYFLCKSTQEIAEAFRDRLTADTNTLIDISSRDPYIRKLASELNIQIRLPRKERHRYQQGDLELKEAVTNISHDLRTPLTAISGYLDLLEREEKSETTQRYLSHIQNRTEVLKNLTEEPVWRQLDAGAVNRIFSNIISNALKYSDGDLSVVMEPDGSITFSNTSQALNTVAVGKLFDRFYTVEASRNSTGLGLSIAKILTERMGGSISANYFDEKLYITITFTN